MVEPALPMGMTFSICALSGNHWGGLRGYMLLTTQSFSRGSGLESGHDRKFSIISKVVCGWPVRWHKSIKYGPSLCLDDLTLLVVKPCGNVFWFIGISASMDNTTVEAKEICQQNCHWMTEACSKALHSSQPQKETGVLQQIPINITKYVQCAHFVIFICIG